MNGVGFAKADRLLLLGDYGVTERAPPRSGYHVNGYQEDRQ